MRSLYIQAEYSDAGKIIFSTSGFPLVETPAATGRLLFSIIDKNQGLSGTNLNVRKIVDSIEKQLIIY